MQGTKRVFLSGWAAHHPEGRLTNDDLVARLDTTHEWLEDRVGIRERRKSAPDQTLANLAAESARPAIERAGLQVSDIDAILGTSSFDDFTVPALAARVGAEIGSDVAAFDVKAACSGWLVELMVAEGLLLGGRASHVLTVAAEKTDCGVDPASRLGAPFFGDAAAAAVVQLERPTEGLEVLDLLLSSDNSMHDAVEVPHGGSFRMEADRTRTWVEAAIAKISQELLDRAGVGVADLRALVCHQANLRLIERIAADLGVPEVRHWHNVAWAGNTASAGAPTALFEGIEEHRSELRDGDLFLVVTVGAGLNVIGALLRWVAD